MTKPVENDTPEGQSRENAISSRTIEADGNASNAQPHRPSRTPSGDGPNAQPSRSAFPEQETGNASHANRREQEQDTAGEQTPDDPTDAAPYHRTGGTQPTGDVPLSRSFEPPAGDDRHARTRGIAQRLQSEGRWTGQAENTRNDLMKLAKKRFSDKESRQQWVYGELDRMYPPVVKALRENFPQALPDGASKGVTSNEGQIQGLSDLPSDWPDLPSNASLSLEIGWVQANRLRMVLEQPGKATRVRLEQALSPAPSWAALGWLETSIRSYAKYVDVAAKATSADDGDETAVMRRERKSIDELRALLAEMEEDGDE